MSAPSPAPAARRARRSRTNSLSRRLATTTLLFSVLVSILVTAFQLWSDYRQQTQDYARRLDEIERSFVPSLASSLWLVDAARVDLLLDGVAQLPGVGYVRLQGTEGEQLVRGDARARVVLERRYPLVYVDGRRFALGTLDVRMSDAQILAQLRSRVVARMVLTTITLGFGAMLLLMLFRHWVTRHLKTMARYTQGLQLSGLSAPLELRDKAVRDPPDELDQVVLSINAMRESMQQDLALRERYEAELLEHRERLEDTVKERTRELLETSRELQRQKEELQRLAYTDHLTGVSSRRYFTELAQHEIARSRRMNDPLSVLIFDLDHFKQINDHHGHAVGDIVLKACCRTCGQQMRDVDVIGRLGGEEFAILMPGTGLALGAAVADRLRQSLADLQLEAPDGTTITFTASFGVSALGSADDDIDTLLKIADDALYEAKRLGRNRVCVEARGG